MKPQYVDAQLRRTSVEEERAFDEISPGKERLMRCYKQNALDAAKAASLGRKFHPLGGGRKGVQIEVGDLEFTWSIFRDAWAFTGKFYSIVLEPTCSWEDAEAWLTSFFVAERQLGALHHGENVTHVLGLAKTGTVTSPLPADTKSAGPIFRTLIGFWRYL